MTFNNYFQSISVTLAQQSFSLLTMATCFLVAILTLFGIILATTISKSVGSYILYILCIVMGMMSTLRRMVFLR